MFNEDEHQKPIHKLFYLITGTCNCGVRIRVPPPAPAGGFCQPCKPGAPQKPNVLGMSMLAPGVPPAAEGETAGDEHDTARPRASVRRDRRRRPRGRFSLATDRRRRRECGARGRERGLYNVGVLVNRGRD